MSDYESHIEEKKEQILMQYKRSYDLDTAFLLCGVSEEEQKMLRRDKSFMFRVAYQDAMVREDILQKMLDLSDSPDPRIQQKALNDLGNILWPERFKGKGTKDNDSTLVPDQIILEGK